MLRLVRKLTFVPVALILVGFVVFTIFIAKPLRGSERLDLVRGTVKVVPELRADAPLSRYVALYQGKLQAADALPAFPVNDVQTGGDGRFQLSPNEEDGTQFFILARVETTKLERYCEEIALPPVRQLEDKSWVDAQTGKPLAAMRITVDKGERCD